MSGKHSVNLSISAGVLNLLPNFQKKNKKKMGERSLDMNAIFQVGVAGEDRGEIFQDGGGGCSLYIKIN